MAKGQRRTRTGDFIPDPMIPLIRVARAQIDAAQGGPLGWLVEFVREDPEAWLPGQVEAHGHHLLALVYGPLHENLRLRGSGPILPITSTDVVEVHDELRDFFHQLVTGPAGVPVKVPTDGLTEVLIRASKPSTETLVHAAGPREVPAIFVVSRGGLRRTLLFQNVKTLVLESGDRLMACPTCEKPFLALRKKKFCSPACLQAWHDAKRPKKGGRA